MFTGENMTVQNNDLSLFVCNSFYLFETSVRKKVIETVFENKLFGSLIKIKVNRAL